MGAAVAGWVSRRDRSGRRSGPPAWRRSRFRAGLLLLTTLPYLPRSWGGGGVGGKAGMATAGACGEVGG